MSKIHYGKCEKCGYMGGLNNNLVCLCCIDEKKLLSKRAKNEIQSLKAQIEEYKDAIDLKREAYNLLKEACKSYKAQIDLLEKAVDFYADKEMYNIVEIGKSPFNDTICYRENDQDYIIGHGDTGGKLARQTKQELEKLRTNKGK